MRFPEAKEMSSCAVQVTCICVVMLMQSELMAFLQALSHKECVGGLMCPKGLDLRDLAVLCTVTVPCIHTLTKTLDIGQNS